MAARIWAVLALLVGVTTIVVGGGASPANASGVVMSGVVRDASGSPVSGVDVTLGDGTNTASSKSGANGSYQLQVPPGTYDKYVTWSPFAGSGGSDQNVAVTSDPRSTVVTGNVSADVT